MQIPSSPDADDIAPACIRSPDGALHSAGYPDSRFPGGPP